MVPDYPRKRLPAEAINEVDKLVGGFVMFSHIQMHMGPGWVTWLELVADGMLKWNCKIQARSRRLVKSAIENFLTPSRGWGKFGAGSRVLKNE